MKHELLLDALKLFGKIDPKNSLSDCDRHNKRYLSKVSKTVQKDYQKEHQKIFQNVLKPLNVEPVHLPSHVLEKKQLLYNSRG